MKTEKPVRYRKQIKIISCEVRWRGAPGRETAQRYHSISQDCLLLANYVWETWQLWNARNDSRQKLKLWLDQRKANGKEAAGDCPVLALPPDLTREIEIGIKRLCPHLGSRVLDLAKQRVLRTIISGKAARGVLPRYQAVLLYHEGRPSFCRPLPIPFDARNTTIEPPAEPGGNFHLLLRLSQAEGNGRKLRWDRIELHCQGRGMESQVANLRKLVDPESELKFCGSNLVYSRGKKKWFAQIAFQQPRRNGPERDPTRIGILSAGKDVPLILITPNGRCLPGQTGRYIAPQRRKLLLNRWSRGQNYQHRAQKGRGRHQVPNWKASGFWKHFTMRCSRGWVKQIKKRLDDADCGRLIYRQPEGEFTEGRFLHWAGKIPGRRDSTGWPWFILGNLLREMCQENGIVFECKKDNGGLLQESPQS